MIKRVWHSLLDLVYNALSRIAKRLHMTGSELVSIGIILFPIGFTVVALGLERHDWSMVIAGILTGIVGFLMLAISERQAKKSRDKQEQKDKKQDEREAKRDREQAERDNHIITLLEAIAKKLGANAENNK